MTDVVPPEPSPNPAHYDALLAGLATRVIDEAVGATIPARARLSHDEPTKLWLGQLVSAPKLIADVRAGFTNSERLIPPAQGFAFRVTQLPMTLTLSMSCCVYVALHPSLAEQNDAVTAATDTPEDDTDHDDTDPHAGSAAVNAGPTAAAGQQPAVASGRGPGYKLAGVWTKVPIDPVTVTVTLTGDSPRAVQVGQAEATSALRAAVAARAPELYRPRRVVNPAGSRPRADDLLDETTWARYCSENLLDIDDVIAPEFRAAIDIEVSAAEGNLEVLATVINLTPAPDTQTIDGTHPYDRSYLNTSLYEVELHAELDQPLRPYELEQVAQSYRYDRTVDALGHACAVKADTRADGASLQTLFAAEQRTSRVYPRLEHRHADGVIRPIVTTFDAMITDPVGAVGALIAAHRDWIEQNWSPQALDARGAARGWDSAARTDAYAEAAAARAEVDWMQTGLNLLAADSDVREAFVLANGAMKASANGAYDSWRPFQIAWIVGCLPGMADPAAHSDVEIVWFSTGGGKSEAYLGLMAATLFYGRLTGVTAGAQVWARFPLRLLALQQTERFAAIVLHAEVLRAADPRIAAGDRFGLGYFVGGTNTPNKLQRPDPTNPFYRGVDPFDPATAEACRVLENCPLCGNRLEVTFDEPSWSMRHICRTAGCKAAGVLPVWGIDDEIYRHAPSVLVGTVDKLAQLAQATEFQVLLGCAHSRCPAHGYGANPSWCPVFPCRAARQTLPAGFGHVRLEIADELHLLDESLGALDGMYETLLQEISAALGNTPMQIVGATATIEGFENQVKHLYRRSARRFPVNGPDVGETFWATTDISDPLRRYVGVRPRGVTMVTATREVAQAHARWLADLLTDPAAVLTEAGLDPADPQLLATAEVAARDLYEVLVAYCLRTEDLTSFTRDPKVQELLPNHANLAIISGDAAPSEIRNAVRRLTKPPAGADDRVKMIAATRAIGHGFDVARLGVMVVMGTPTSAAEIIQASARVGRAWPGLVINVINPTRDRDASVFRYYADWIRFLDRLVHKVPVNRESLPVLRRVLSGGLMAWLMQVHDRGWLTSGPRRKSLAQSTQFRDANTTGYIDRTLLIDDLTCGFGIHPSSVFHALHRTAIQSWVDDQLAVLPMQAAENTRLPELLSPNVPTSLRDVEEPIIIHGEI